MSLSPACSRYCHCPLPGFNVSRFIAPFSSSWGPLITSLFVISQSTVSVGGPKCLVSQLTNCCRYGVFFSCSRTGSIWFGYMLVCPRDFTQIF